MRRASLLLLLVAMAPAALAQVLRFDPQQLVIEVGETAAVLVTPGYMWSGSNSKWTFTTGNTSVIQVAGKGSSLGGGTMLVTGLRPGRARALVAGYDASQHFVDVTVRCGDEPPVQAAEPRQPAKSGEPLTLRALTPIAERTTFTWYHGLAGDLSAPIAASGPELVYAAGGPGLHHVWVLATTPCSTSMAQFEVNVAAPKRRSART